MASTWAGRHAPLTRSSAAKGGKDTEKDVHVNARFLMNRSGWSVIDRSADIPMCGRRSSVDYLESNLPVRTYTSVPGTSRAWIEDRKSIAGRKYRRYLHVIISEEVRCANNTRWRARVITDGFHPPSHPSPRRPVCKFPSPVGGDIFYFFFFFFRVRRVI